MSKTLTKKLTAKQKKAAKKFYGWSASCVTHYNQHREQYETAVGVLDAGVRKFDALLEETCSDNLMRNSMRRALMDKLVAMGEDTTDTTGTRSILKS